MSLEKWVEYGWLRREPTSTGEIKDHSGNCGSYPLRPRFDSAIALLVQHRIRPNSKQISTGDTLNHNRALYHAHAENGRAARRSSQCRTKIEIIPRRVSVIYRIEPA